MLTIRFDQLGVQPGDLVLDAGAGFGRHAFALARHGANVVALDYASSEVAATRATFAAMAEAGEIAEERFAGGLRGDATNLPFADHSFDRVITSEVLEHIEADTAAIREFVRVLKPGGTFAATVPTWLPEKINWMLSDEYHAPKAVGGHVRIYTANELKAKLRSAGLAVIGSHHAHALHSPYWWLKCAVGVRRDDHRLVKAYKKLLEWEITKQPRGMKVVERAVSPVLGKSYVVYATKTSERANGHATAA
ncbi:MAG: class I SAM-dependent methyltransferase [Ilumatobacteraceae bacterium]